ncbi:symmetrical bis(5'-nucleosyl)-tetraphosphatase [Ralstonia nicotianae]|uniref:symmetrical bis(5'-nucleosyl)-tetraphosphatase n=1 Tax=Ralstonia pseudosolanacearum TaxID=1310165 RepID=UPI000B3B5D48|nr:symmetrical bis(5'-nucleosyl)-tetraphosphatase [Ralstonia pseudosolanacearum]ARU22396.1 Dihydrolipoamide succinyltransferase component (E2) of 2-oxoglutarate dehydrogenase complex [Ralstonia solanacearum]MDO3526263.1 symmetrical bis(5'-nucleosyl)-tetraphosphatase [Ralstonia pseudosolanacearum]MDO3531343.1 symmetrical bis(5'-nucleosyl)-tetraphosphatase [Ralstonia pseudosolanacearum]MDO3560841.1 symmetrical bis(5'-nucleosyl)-tetraphosphatase [Ralstonia pseudosolanacearum]MDO3571845.1 symmetri
MTVASIPPHAIGDLQGCCSPLQTLLTALPANAPLRFVGDLVNRGPDSLGTLRRVIMLCEGGRARAVLGNHDIHLLAVAAGVRKLGKRDTLDDILGAPDCDALIHWLRHQPLAIFENGFLMVHAGVLPQWTTGDVLELAGAVERELRSPHWKTFLADAFGNQPAKWSSDLIGIDRLRLTINALTRLRFCTPDGAMEFETTDADGAPDGHVPWFDVPGRRTRGTPIAFGHWSTRGLVMRDDLLGLDTGCVWGGKLTAARMTLAPAGREVIQVACEQAQDPLAHKK